MHKLCSFQLYVYVYTCLYVCVCVYVYIIHTMYALLYMHILHVLFKRLSTKSLCARARLGLISLSFLACVVKCTSRDAHTLCALGGLWNTCCVRAAPLCPLRHMTVCCIEQSGFESFRIELVDEPAHQVAPLLEGYRALLRSEISWRDLWQDLQDVPDANGTPQGVAKGILLSCMCFR
jgi:hypothetical protein